MLSKSYLLSRHNLIIEVPTGTITLDSMIEMRQWEIDAGWIEPGLNTLVVIQAKTIALTTEDLEAYTRWASQRLAPINGSKTAILANSPIATAFSMLLRGTIARIRTMEVFSTLNAAAQWLGVPADEIAASSPVAKTFE